MVSGGFTGVVGLDKHRTGKTRLFSFGRFALITHGDLPRSVGLAFLADLAPCQYRMGAIHSHWPGLEYQLTQVGPWLDGVFCDSQAIAESPWKGFPT